MQMHSLEAVLFILFGSMVVYDATRDFLSYQGPRTRGQFIWTGFRFIVGGGVIAFSITSLINF